MAKLELSYGDSKNKGVSKFFDFLSLYKLKPNPFQPGSCITHFSCLLHVSQAALMTLTPSFLLVKTEHVLHHHQDNNSWMQAVLSMKSYQRDGVFDTHFLTQTEQSLPNPHHLNSPAAGSGMLYLKCIYWVIPAEEFLFEQIKKVTSCLLEPQMYFSSLTPYRDVLLSDLETATASKTLGDACSHDQALS